MGYYHYLKKQFLEMYIKRPHTQYSEKFVSNPDKNNDSIKDSINAMQCTVFNWEDEQIIQSLQHII